MTFHDYLVLCHKLNEVITDVTCIPFPWPMTSKTNGTLLSLNSCQNVQSNQAPNNCMQGNIQR